MANPSLGFRSLLLADGAGIRRCLANDVGVFRRGVWPVLAFKTLVIITEFFLQELSVLTTISLGPIGASLVFLYTAE